MFDQWESRSDRERREASEVDERQRERARTPGVRLDDPISKDDLLTMRKAATLRTSISVLLGWEVVIAYGYQVEAEAKWIPLLIGILIMTPILWISTVSAWELRIRAQRHLTGLDPIYWQPCSEDRSSDADTRPHVLWYEIKDRDHANYDSKRNISLMIWGIGTYGLGLGMLAYGMPRQ